TCIFVLLIAAIGLGSFPAVAQNGTEAGSLVYAATLQDAGQAAPPAVTVPPSMPPQPPPVELPDGEGKAIATEYCQDCHRLTNLTRAHKSLDDWKDSVQLMIDRGARIPPENVDTLAQYLAKNFGPKPQTPAGGAQPAAGAPSTTAAPAAAPAPPAPTAAPEGAASATAAVPAAASATATAGASAAAGASPEGTAAAPASEPKPVVLPDGPGKEVATEVCQECHRLTNLTRAHKSLDDWKDTVQLMIDRGADVPPDKVDLLVKYLAKNFGPKAADAGANAPSAGAAHGSTAQ
ncbi:MAG: hypothetical protein ACRD4Y_01325, partial [Candidatus Acidiferrales bacterium]